MSSLNASFVQNMSIVRPEYFFITGLSGDGPCESVTAFIELVLVCCESPLTVDITDDNTSPTPDPEPSQTPRHCAELQSETTADGESATAATDEPSLKGVTELWIASEPEPQVTSDQVREPATKSDDEDITMEHECAEGSPTHCSTDEGELRLDSENLIDFYSDVPSLPSSSACPVTAMKAIYELPVCPELSACLELPVCPVMTIVQS
ncbi:hypothetical protein cypCar_00033347 [Cyprinus carpio]|nr:hypothetical protein cypCar_00033347 [Cyprinus carpio]